MNREFDAFLQELQAHIFVETKREFGDKVCGRWQNPLYMKTMPNPDGQARLQGTCGDSMEIFLKFEGNNVVDASFQTDGCGPTVVCGSYAAELALGKKPDDIFDITAQRLLEEVGGLPPDHRHCASLAAACLHAAVDDYMRKQTRTSSPT